MVSKGSSKRISILEISPEDFAVLKCAYDNTTIEHSHLISIARSFNEGKITNEKVVSVMEKYDTLNITTDDLVEAHQYEHEIDMNETNARYAGYAAALARKFRFLGFSSKISSLARRFHYLALASDFGEAMRPVVSATAVNTSLAISVGYCIADVAWEGYKLKSRNYHTEKGEPMTMTQCIVERASFQLVASMILPTIIIQSSVDLTTKYTNKFRRFTKWGPTLVGLSVIPFLPLYVDPFVGKFKLHVMQLNLISQKYLTTINFSQKKP